MARSRHQDPILKYRYQVYIDGIDVQGGFSRVSGLNVKVSTIPYRLSGINMRLHGRIRPGLVQPYEVTLTKGVFIGESLETWVEMLVPSMRTESGSSGRRTIANRRADARTTVDIMLMAPPLVRPPIPLIVTRHWRLFEAWPTEYDSMGGGLDSMSSEILFESVTLVCEEVQIQTLNVGGRYAQ